MFLIYNLRGIYMIGGACLAAVVSMRIPPLQQHSGVPILAIGIVCVIADLVYRAVYGKRRFLHRLHGGHLYFVPVWIIGGLFVWLGVRMYAAGA